MVQMVCDRPSQIITLQKEINDLKYRKFLPTHCDHTETENRIQILTAKRDESWKRPAASGTDKVLRQELVDMLHDTQQSGEEVRGLRTQSAYSMTLEATAAPAAPQGGKHRGLKIPDYRDISVSD
jgi:hypothetical protein